MTATEVLNALTLHADLFSRSEAVSKPTPVPAAPGIYAWYFKEPPGVTPIHGCVRRTGLTLLYVGISPKNERSKQNLRKRLRQHLGGNAEGSTLRKTLGVLLARQSGFPLRRVGSGGRKTLTHRGEQWLDKWMSENAHVCWVEHPKPYEVEAEVIHALSLPLPLCQQLFDMAHSLKFSMAFTTFDASLI